MSKTENGWAGANISRDGYCNRCLKDFDGCEMRNYHGPDGVHVAFCSECADKVGLFWYACGCGG
jgi:hypothetical protein